MISSSPVWFLVVQSIVWALILIGFFGLGVYVNHPAAFPVVLATSRYTRGWFAILGLSVILMVIALDAFDDWVPLVVNAALLLVMILARLREEEWSLLDVIDVDSETIRDSFFPPKGVREGKRNYPERFVDVDDDLGY